MTPQFIGSLPDGFELTSVTVDPEILSVIGKIKNSKQVALVLVPTPTFQTKRGVPIKRCFVIRYLSGREFKINLTFSSLK